MKFDVRMSAARDNWPLDVYDANGNLIDLHIVSGDTSTGEITHLSYDFDDPVFLSGQFPRIVSVFPAPLVVVSRLDPNRLVFPVET